MKTYYMVYNPSTGYTKFKHAEYAVAKTEAIRMAQAHPGDEFVVLVAVASIKKTDVVVDEVSPMDWIPFYGSWQPGKSGKTLKENFYGYCDRKLFKIR